MHHIMYCCSVRAVIVSTLTRASQLTIFPRRGKCYGQYGIKLKLVNGNTVRLEVGKTVSKEAEGQQHNNKENNSGIPGSTARYDSIRCV